MTTITKRDKKLFIKLNEAAWLTTSQIQTYFFEGKATNAVNKRMRKLEKVGYVFSDRKSSTDDYLYRLTNKSKQYLLIHSGVQPENIQIPKRLPQNLKHFIGINDLRCHIERNVQKQSGEMLLFSTDREIKTVIPNSIIIPDALARFKLFEAGKEKIYNYILEYDNETENASYFAKSKVKKYLQILQSDNSLFGLRPVKVLVFADRLNRVLCLVKQSLKLLTRKNLFYFSTMEHLERDDFLFGSYLIDPFKQPLVY